MSDAAITPVARTLTARVVLAYASNNCIHLNNLPILMRWVYEVIRIPVLPRHVGEQQREMSCADEIGIAMRGQASGTSSSRG